MKVAYNPTSFGGIIRAILLLAQGDADRFEWGVIHQMVVDLRKNIETAYGNQPEIADLKTPAQIALGVLRQVERNRPLHEIIVLSSDDLLSLAE